MKRNERRQWILLGLIMLLGMMKSCTQPDTREYPEVRVYHLNDIYYVTGTRVHSESGKIDSLCESKADAFDYLEELTVQEVKSLPRVILQELKGSLLVYDEKFDQYYWSITSSYYPHWSVDVTYERPSPGIDKVFIPIRANADDGEDTGSRQAWKRR